VVGGVAQNTLAAALKEWGTLRRTIHSAKYLSTGLPAQDLPAAQQGESLHALRRDLHYANRAPSQSPPGAADRAGVVPDRPDQCRGDVVDGVLLPRVAQLRGQGRDIRRGPDHISPAHSENINFFGVITSMSTPNSPSSTRRACGTTPDGRA